MISLVKQSINEAAATMAMDPLAVAREEERIAEEKTIVQAALAAIDLETERAELKTRGFDLHVGDYKPMNGLYGTVLTFCPCPRGETGGKTSAYASVYVAVSESQKPYVSSIFLSELEPCESHVVSLPGCEARLDGWRVADNTTHELLNYRKESAHSVSLESSLKIVCDALYRKGLLRHAEHTPAPEAVPGTMG
jgi:hypothetical protein